MSQRERIDISDQLNDALQVSFSFALSGSYISGGLGSGRRNWRQGDWLRVSNPGPDGRSGLDKGHSRGNGKDGCWRDGFERHQEGDVGTGCFLITMSSKTLTNHGLQDRVLPLCQALCAKWFTYFLSLKLRRSSEVSAVAEGEEGIKDNQQNVRFKRLVER